MSPTNDARSQQISLYRRFRVGKLDEIEYRNSLLTLVRPSIVKTVAFLTARENSRDDCLSECYQTFFKTYRRFNPLCGAFITFFAPRIKNAIKRCRAMHSLSSFPRKRIATNGCYSAIEDKQMASKLLSTLASSRQRKIVSMHLCQGLLFREIGSELGISPSRAEQIFSVAFSTLKREARWME